MAASHFRNAAAESEAIRGIIMRYGEILLIQVQQTAAVRTRRWGAPEPLAAAKRAIGSKAIPSSSRTNS